MSRILRWVRTYPLVYQPLKRLRRSDADEYLCRRTSDLCLEGYPSSGNSFAYVLIRISGPDLSIAHHCHAVANLKLALRYNVKAVALVRDPAEAVTSRVARFGPRLEEAVEDYISFNSFVWKNRARLLIATFPEVTEGPADFVRRVARFTGIDLTPGDPATLHQRVIAEINQWTREHGEYGRASLPREERELIKNGLRPKLTSVRRWAEAVELWDRIRCYHSDETAAPELDRD